MTKRLSIISALVLLSVTSMMNISSVSPAAQGKYKTFKKSGVSFRYHPDWKIKEKKKEKTYQSYIFKTETGGYFAVFIYNAEMDAEETMNTFKDAYSKNLAGLTYTGDSQTKFGDYDCQKCSFKVVQESEEINGNIYCFPCSGKTLLVVYFATALTYQHHENTMFNIAKKTFTCKYD
jgi:DNA-directed RNA polymerase subunit RPC12/RpoP